MLVRDVIRELKKCPMDARVQVMKKVPFFKDGKKKLTLDFENMKSLEAIRYKEVSEDGVETQGYVQLSA